MPLYLVRREVPGVSQEEMDAAAFRAIACAFYFEGMKWHQSYWDKEAGVINCVYEAKDPAEVFAHAERARIPCNEVREVTIVAPEFYAGQELTELTPA
jgi:hypothetical protein